MPHKDPEARKKYMKEWTERNKDKVTQYEKTRYAKHTEKRKAALCAWKEQNKEKVLEIGKRWVKNNKATVNAKNAKRRALVGKATPLWLTDFDVLKMKAIYQVASMLTVYGNEPHHVDHIVPLKGKTVCGLHVPWNLRVLPASENMQKGNKL